MLFKNTSFGRFAVAGTSAIIIFISLVLFFSFSTGSEVKNRIPYPEPANDFSFLKRFVCITDLLGRDHWHNQKGRSFSKEGVHLTNGKSHPVNACHYALFCYDEYKRTGDSSLLSGFMNQVKYLMDESSYHVMDTDMVAYPYMIRFHDLSPPWYSALAQSEAISVLIRYYALTRDTSALPLIIKLKNFMVNPQEYNCGTMSKTSEGYTWYEEYPNSKREQQVLNGFYLSIVALYEYSMLFPGDTISKSQYLDAIKTVKATFSHYNTGAWIKYNRGDGRNVGNGYMKWQILELKLLYEITGDIYFRNVMMLMATYGFNKPYDAVGVKLKDHDFSVPLTMMHDGTLRFAGKEEKIMMNTKVIETQSSWKLTEADKKKLFDENLHTFVMLKKDSSADNGKSFFEFEFTDVCEPGSFSITYSRMDSVTKPDLEIFRKDSVESRKWRRVKALKNTADHRTEKYVFRPVQGKVFRIVFDDSEWSDSLYVADVSFHSPPRQSNSEFQHYLTNVYKLESDNMSLTFSEKNLKSYTVFCRVSSDESQLSKQKWDPLKAGNSLPYRPGEKAGLLCQFLVVIEPGNGFRNLEGIQFR